MILFASGKYNVEENRKFYASENAKRRSPGSDPSIKALTKIDSHRRMERNTNKDKLCGYIIISSGYFHTSYIHNDTKEWKFVMKASEKRQNSFRKKTKYFTREPLITFSIKLVEFFVRFENEYNY